MILAARERESLREVLVIASSLSVQDVRDRPLEHQQAADQAHLKFDDEKSEFLGVLKLWSWLESSRGGHGEHRLSSRKHEQLLRDNFVSPRRVREWRDVFAQLQQVVTEHGWRVNTLPATYEQLHLSMLAGLLGNIGLKSDEDDSYLGARGIRFHRHPGLAPLEEAGPLDRRRRAGGDDPALCPRHRQHRPALAGDRRRPPAEEAAARAALGEEGRARWSRSSGRRSTAWSSTATVASTSARSIRPQRARSSSARRWSKATGKRSCRSPPPTAS
jgi:hypothetical protein